MNSFLKIFMGLFSSLPWLFLTSIFFTVVSFHFVKKIVANVRSGLFFPILFGIVNGVIATTMETMVEKNLPYVIMFFVPLAVVTEVFCVSKNPFRVYVFLLGAFLINYSGTYSLALAASGLLWPDLPAHLSGVDYRVFIFSLVTVLSSSLVLVWIRFIPMRELRSITYKMEQNLMLVLYMYTAGITFLIATKMSASMLFESHGVDDHLQVIYLEMLIKDFMVLIGGYIILLFRCREEGQKLRAVDLKNDLQLEEAFRSSIQEKALCSYSYNATKDRIEQMHPVFNSYTSNPIHAKYSEMINHYIEMCVHPDDQDALRSEVVYLDIAKKLQLKVNALQVRMRKEFLQSFCSTANAREIEALVAHSGDWIWIEVRDTCITDVATGDLLVYVDLFNVEDVVQEKTQLVVAATTDMLTNLNNRSAAEKRMREFLFNKNQDGAFFILDLDNFKLVNDRFGHPEGDKVLRDVAQIIRSVFRDNDVMARLGGDEFCIYAPGMMSVETVNRCVSALLSRCCFEYTYKESCFAVTASIGVVFASQANYEYTTLYEYADQALYSAKTKGKNTWSLYKAEN